MPMLRVTHDVDVSVVARPGVSLIYDQGLLASLTSENKPLGAVTVVRSERLEPQPSDP
jgi:hypothetical protein